LETWNTHHFWCLLILISPPLPGPLDAHLLLYPPFVYALLDDFVQDDPRCLDGWLETGVVFVGQGNDRWIFYKKTRHVIRLGNLP